MSNRKLYPLIYRYVPNLIIEAGADKTYLQNLNNQIERCCDRYVTNVQNDLGIILHDMFGVGVIHSTLIKDGCRYDYYTDQYGKIKIELKTYLSGEVYSHWVSFHTVFTAISIQSDIRKCKTIYTGVEYSSNHLITIDKSNIHSNDKDKFIDYILTHPFAFNNYYVTKVKNELNNVITSIENVKAIIDSGASYKIIV